MPPAQHHTEYAPPVLRAPSPASSVGTAYGADQTTYSDTESQMSQTAFERKWQERLELSKARKEEEHANRSPLLHPTPKSAAEEKALYERVMRSLRYEVNQLEENELFEQTLLRGSQVALEQQPASNDIDALMRSLMGAPTKAHHTHKNTNAPGYANNHANNINGNHNYNHGHNVHITNGPWNSNGCGYHYEGGGGGSGGGGVESIYGGGSTAGKRSINITSKGKGRSRKT